MYVCKEGDYASSHLSHIKLYYLKFFKVLILTLWGGDTFSIEKHGITINLVVGARITSWVHLSTVLFNLFLCGCQSTGIYLWKEWTQVLGCVLCLNGLKQVFSNIIWNGYIKSTKSNARFHSHTVRDHAWHIGLSFDVHFRSRQDRHSLLSPLRYIRPSIY